MGSNNESKTKLKGKNIKNARKGERKRGTRIAGPLLQQRALVFHNTFNEENMTSQVESRVWWEGSAERGKVQRLSRNIIGRLEIIFEIRRRASDS
jgi:hypothetical protein